MKLLFGTAGIPVVTKLRNTENGIATVRRLGLDAMELEFVHSVNISMEKAPLIKEIAGKNNILLTCHAPYYINLSGDKAAASAKRLHNAAHVLNACGGWSVCFHAGFYLGNNHGTVYGNMKREIKGVVSTLRNDGNDVWIRPEIGGRLTSFGSLDELIRLSEDIEGVMPCIDFAHMHARTNGKYNSYAEFAALLEEMERRLGRQALENMHIHMSGINYSERGERNHLVLEESDMKYKELVKTWKDFHIGGVVISESPNIEEDALRLQKALKRL
jgi:deoxyribonuclease-4